MNKKNNKLEQSNSEKTSNPPVYDKECTLDQVGSFSESIQEYEYLGWIPCVVGRLDFSKTSTEQLKYDKPDSICLSYMDQHNAPIRGHRTRYNVTSSVCDWKDRKDPNNKFSGIFRFLTVFTTQPNGDATGQAFLWAQKEETKSPHIEKEVLKPLRTLQNQVSNYEKSLRTSQYDPTQKLGSEFVENTIRDACDAITRLNSNELKHRIIVVNFHIASNGLTVLKTEVRDGVDNSEDEARRKEAEHSSFISAKQAFIYLKYTLHTHKHHPEQEDRLTIVHYIDKGNTGDLGLKLIEDLRRSAIEIKGTAIKNEPSAEHLLHGFISYTKSLIEALNEKGLISKETASIKKSFFDNMLGSWESIIQKAKEQKEQNKERKAKETKAIDDSLQAISMLLATISVFFVGIKFTLGSVSGCSPSEISWALKLTCSIISDKELVLNIFISILFTMLLSLIHI